ncbi:MAG: hypothetical protein LBB92_02505 [Endomicrobium sp.]|nr:hypothetical protein [Endomicrobium sp.]
MSICTGIGFLAKKVPIICLQLLVVGLGLVSTVDISNKKNKICSKNLEKLLIVIAVGWIRSYIAWTNVAF